jgi:hypothetical protein
LADYSCSLDHPYLRRVLSLSYAESFRTTTSATPTDLF